MSEPRRIVPGQMWMLNRRCTQRQFLLRPDPEMNNAYVYCLVEAALKFDIALLLSMMMSNHEHTPFFDPKALAIEFTHRFHTNLAKCVNAYRGRWENMWSSDPPCLVELESIDDLVKQLVYTATNPVQDNLVERVHHWPGPNILRAFLTGRTLKARRPQFFFREDGPMPEEVEITLRVPEELGNHDEIVERVRAGIAAVEDECARKREQDKVRVIGRRRILRQSWRDTPTSHEPRRNLRPRVSARSKWARIEALRRNKEFQVLYREARTRWLAGEDEVVFPAGTYWLRKFAAVQVQVTDPPPKISASK
jgi:putative transposase